MPALVRAIQYDRDTRDYTLYLDGDPVGSACSYHQGELTLDALVSEILTQYTASQVEAPPAQPLPPMDAVADTLDEQARTAADPAPFTEARTQLDSGIPIVADGPTLWIDSCLVLPNPYRLALVLPLWAAAVLAHGARRGIDAHPGAPGRAVPPPTLRGIGRVWGTLRMWPAPPEFTLLI
jgi:hypothetical protein